MAPIRKDVGLLLTRIERAAPAGDAKLAAGLRTPDTLVGEEGHGEVHAPAAEAAH
jgi:hypothetical protein